MYVMHSFGGRTRVDTFAIVPEPASLALVALVCAAGLIIRQSRSKARRA
jgi:hypothetical protein